MKKLPQKTSQVANYSNQLTQCNYFQMDQISVYNDVAYNWRQIQLWQHKNKKQILARESAKKKKKGSFMEG